MAFMNEAISHRDAEKVPEDEINKSLPGTSLTMGCITHKNQGRFRSFSTAQRSFKACH